MSFVSCAFYTKNRYEEIPFSVMTALAEAGCLIIAEGVDYSFNISNRSFDLTYHEACMLLDDDLEELLKKDKLGYRHLRAFFWVKRHMRYEGDSHNHNDWDRHPDDFFEYVEEVIREFFNEKRGENVK